jgi:hypothetical protein
MSREYSTDELVLLGELRTKLTLAEGFKGETKPVPLDEWNKNHKTQIDDPRGLRPGEIVVIKPTLNEEVMLIVVDGEWGRPGRSFILKPSSPDKVGMVPVMIIEHAYDLDLDFHYPVSEYEALPLRVVRQTNETWDCTPRGKKKSRINLSVGRAIYEPDKRSGLFTPYRFIASGEFVLAPSRYQNPYGETGQQFWVEQLRHFEFLGRKVKYQISPDGNLKLWQGGGIASEFSETINPDTRLLSVK